MSFEGALQRAREILGISVSVSKLVDASALEAFCAELMGYYNGELKTKLSKGGYTGTAQDLKSEIDAIGHQFEKVTKEEVKNIIDSIV